MSQLKIFIDFEAISSPFAKDAGLLNNFPYAYTLGLYVGKKFKTKTFIFNFQRDHIDHIFLILKQSIAKNIRLLLAKPNFKLNANSIKFIAWDPILEIKILANIFPNISVGNLNHGNDVSLSRITPEIKKDYFAYVKKLIAQNLTTNFIKKRIANNDGAIAGYVGYLLYSQVNHKHGKYVLDFETKSVLKELRKYSKDDVVRMDFLHTRPQLFNKRKTKAAELIVQKTFLSKNIAKNKQLVSKLKTFGQKQTVGTLVAKLEQKKQNYEKLKLALDDNFDNF